MSAKLLRNIGKMAFAGLMLTLVPPAGAAMLAPAQSETAVAVSAPTGTTVAGPLTQPFSGGSGITAFSGSLVSNVIQENSTDNPLGGLTFTFQFSDNVGSQTPISRFTSDDYTNFLTDVGYVTPGVPATSVDRNTAAVVGWTFTTVGTGAQGFVNPGSSSALLVIRTNAPLYTGITAGLLGGGPATAASYGPLPEPASMALLASGMLLLKRRRV